MRDASSGFDWRWMVLFVALVYLLARGPLRAWDQTVDLPTFYAGTKAWLLGEDPYDHATIKRLYDTSGGDGQAVAMCVNPPGFFPVMAPLGLVGFQAAKVGMMALNLAALGMTLWALLGVFDVHRRYAAGLWLVAGAFALAPVQTTISQGQHGLMVLAAVALAMRAELARRDVLVGVCLAVAAALKPQMVILFGFYYLLMGRWVVVAAGALGTAALLGIGILRMELAGIDWLAGLRANLTAFTSAPRDPLTMAGAANYVAMGDGRFIMVDVAALLHTFTHEPPLICIARLLVGGVIVGLAVWGTLRARVTMATERREQVMTVYALLAAGCVFSAYNRYYAATVLVLAFAVGLHLVATRRWKLGWALLALSGVFFVPGVAVLLSLQRGTLAEHAITGSLVWRYLLLPHQVYAMIGIIVTLSVASLRRPSQDAPASG